MKIDVIVSWPIHLDYPLWRQFIHENRDKFEKVIVVFTDMNAGRDYRVWLQDQFNKDGIISLTNSVIEKDQDWRDVAMHTALGVSDSEWVFFTEQDFFPLDGFWDLIERASHSTEVFGFFQEGRLHPCCIFIKRSLLNTTCLNFGVEKDVRDHFGLIQKDLDDRKIPIGVISSMYGHHFNGLSQNMYLLQIGQEPNYEPEKFKEYCKNCLKVDMQPEIKVLLEKYLEHELIN